MMNTPNVCLHKLLRKLINHPSATICKHYAAVLVIEAMQDLRIEVPVELIQAVVNSDDAKTNAILDKS